MSLTQSDRDVIIKLLRQALANAEDNLIRGEIQQRRMVYDHDNNNEVERDRDRVLKIQHALISFLTL